MKKDLEHYLGLRYPVELVEDEDGGYFAQIPDLPGCISQGETGEETLKNLQEAKQAWIEVRLEDGLEIPAPREVVEEYSGKFLLRVPRSLHRELAMNARREGSSLNQYVLHLISLGLGREPRREQPVQTKELGGMTFYLDALFGARRRGGVSKPEPWISGTWGALASAALVHGRLHPELYRFVGLEQDQLWGESERGATLKEEEASIARQFPR